MDNIKQHLEVYVRKSKELQLSKEILDEKKAAFDLQNKELISDIVTLDTQINNIKENVKEQAESQYKETGEKKLIGGIGIRILSKIKYDNAQAINWANSNMPVAVKQTLDKKQFESYAKENSLDFVEKEELVCVTFPKEIKL